jgi:hypothetical protein
MTWDRQANRNGVGPDYGEGQENSRSFVMGPRASSSRVGAEERIEQLVMEMRDALGRGSGEGRSALGARRVRSTPC